MHGNSPAFCGRGRSEIRDTKRRHVRPPLVRLVFRTSAPALAGPARLGTALLVQNFTQVAPMNVEDVNMIFATISGQDSRVSPVVTCQEFCQIERVTCWGLPSVTRRGGSMSWGQTTYVETLHSECRLSYGTLRYGYACFSE